MKRAVILHGTDASPDINWFPWLKEKLEADGYKVWAPLLPENHTPNKEIYNNFLFGSNWDFTDNVVIGHSSGAVEVLNLLMDDRCPKIRLGIMIGAWAGGPPDNWEDISQFDHLFPENGFDFEKIKNNAGRLEFVHGDNDIYCPVSQAKWLAGKTNSEIHLIPNGGHLGNKFKELPIVWDLISARNLLYR